MNINLQERISKRAVTRKRVERLVCFERRVDLRISSAINSEVLCERRLLARDYCHWSSGEIRVEVSCDLVKKVRK